METIVPDLDSDDDYDVEHDDDTKMKNATMTPQQQQSEPYSSDSEYSTCEFIDDDINDNYKPEERKWISNDELPFYMDLISQYNKKALETMEKQKKSQRIRRAKVQETIGEGDIVFIKPEIKIDTEPTVVNIPSASKRKKKKARMDSNTSPPITVSVPVESEEESKDEEKVLKYFNPLVYPNPGAQLPECTACKIIFKTLEEYRSHVAANHKTGLPFECDVCSKLFLTQPLLKQHQRFHGPKNFICATCGQGFVFEIHLIRHERVHTKVKPYVCPICSRSFTQSGQLKAHGGTHSETKDWECLTCGKKYARKQSLVVHCVANQHVS